jgi:polar amino acid transport system substrate-binding protein
MTLHVVRPLRAALVAGLLVAGLSACGSDDSSASGDALSTVNPVFENALTVCTDMPYEPFEYKGASGAPEGFDMDIAAKVAEKLDLQFDVVAVPFDDIASGKVLNEDRCDLAISAMTITGERSRVLDFSSPYFNSQQALIAAKGTAVGSFADLQGSKVGVQSSTTGLTLLQDNGNGIDIKPFGQADEMLAALKSGQVDAVLMDDVAAAPAVEDLPGFDVVKMFDTGEQYGIAVKKDGNIPLLRSINNTLTELRENGDYDTIYNKYF